MSDTEQDLGAGAPNAGTIGETPVSPPAPGRDGIVEGDQNADLNDFIDTAYADDPEGDRVDNNDATLSNPGSNDDIIEAGAGDDTVRAGLGDDTVYGGDGDDFIKGLEGDDSLLGEAGNDLLRGAEGNDTLVGGAGQNFLEGDAGDDVFVGGVGADSFFGGSGNDVLDYSGSDAPVNVNLDTNSLSGGDAANDSIDGGTAIEGAIGSDGDDTLVGGDGANTFDGGDGNDDITTGVGDTVNGEGGDDYIRIAPDQLAPGETITVIGGETGETLGDTLDLTGLVDDPSQVVLTNDDPGAGGGLTGTATLNDGTIVDFTEIENIVGVDTVPGGGPDGIVSGTAGDDLIELGTETDPDGDVIDANDDILPPNLGSNDDVVAAGDGDDTVNAGDGDDTVSGGAGDDVLSGDDGDDVVNGGSGDDTINAGVGDTVSGGGGDDYFRPDADQLAPGETIEVIGGETGEVLGDTLDLTDLVDDPDAQITYTNTDPGAGGGLTGTATLNDGTIVDFTEIENVLTDDPVSPPPPPTGGPDGIVTGTDGDDEIIVGSDVDPDGDEIDANDAILPPNPGSNDDIVEAGGGDDTVNGADGDDDIDGGAGDDSLSGGVGDDTIGDPDGADTVDGGTGDDVIDVSGGDPLVDSPVVPGIPTAADTDPDDDRDSVDGGDGNDTISTGDDADTINGGVGDDVINPGIDDDSVTGGAGDDLINDIQGSDTIFGGDGNDTINAGIDTLSDYVGDDPSLPNPLFPGATSDPNPEDGRDFVDGGAGDDSITTGDDRDTIIGGAGDDTVNAGIDDDDINGGAGNDSLTGSHGSDTIQGGGGDDTIYGGFGNDPIAGFPGEDPDVAVGAGDTPDPVPENGRDVLAGGAGNDLIFGEDDDDTLTGGSGEDTLDGGVDDDSISGGADNDSLIGGQGDDTLDGGMGDDTLDGGSGANNLFGGEGDDSITGGDDDDTVIGGFGDDTISVGDGDDTVQGGAGDDSIVAGPGDDTIEGNDGEDTINGGLGDDLLSGNDDADLFQGVNGGDTVSGGAGFGPDSEDFDVLNLAGSVGNTPGAVRFAIEDTVTDSDGNGIDGSIVYYDAADAVVGEIEFTNIEEIVPCFTPGSLIATPKGERLVEELVEGDRVITRDNGIQTIRWVGQKGLNGAALHDAPHMQPILIKAGALGNGLPERDMLVSPNHRVLVASEKTSLYFEEREVLVAAKHMIDGKGVMQVEASATTYIHFMFDRHEVVLSDGAWTESFQPGDYSLKGLANEQRAEIFELFPELEQQEGLSNYEAARRTLKKHEAKLLQK